MPFTKEQKARLVQLGLKVKQIRNEKGLTLKELAHAVDKDPQSIHRLEVGGVNPSFLYLLQICEGLNIPPQELISEN